MPERDYMKLALSLAAKARESTYPNPMVGAVIVRAGKIVGKGYHKKAGQDHAEIIAIKEAADKSKGADMYVTLEPCDHYGKTPPCTRAIIKSGIKKVEIGMVDPNPVTGGKGIRRLKRAGIEISFGRYGERIAHLNRKYIKAVKTGLPYITLKTAQTLDGKIAARDGSSKWISGERSRKYVKKIRSRYDAIIIGTNTLLKDDPFLLDERKKGYNVRRVVIDSELKIPLSSNIIRTADKSPVLIVITEKAKYGKIREVSAVKGVDIIKIRSRQGRVSLRPLLKNLYRRGIINVMLEGGGELAGSFLEEELIDEIMFFISPKLLGGPYNSLKGRGLSSIGKAVDISEFSFRRFNGDLLITGRVKKR